MKINLIHERALGNLKKKSQAKQREAAEIGVSFFLSGG